MSFMSVFKWEEQRNVAAIEPPLASSFFSILFGSVRTNLWRRNEASSALSSKRPINSRLDLLPFWPSSSTGRAELLQSWFSARRTGFQFSLTKLEPSCRARILLSAIRIRFVSFRFGLASTLTTCAKKPRQELRLTARAEFVHDNNSNNNSDNKVNWLALSAH